MQNLRHVQSLVVPGNVGTEPCFARDGSQGGIRSGRRIDRGTKGLAKDVARRVGHVVPYDRGRIVVVVVVVARQ